MGCRVGTQGSGLRVEGEGPGRRVSEGPGRRVGEGPGRRVGALPGFRVWGVGWATRVQGSGCRKQSTLGFRVWDIGWALGANHAVFWKLIIYTRQHK